MAASDHTVCLSITRVSVFLINSPSAMFLQRNRDNNPDSHAPRIHRRPTHHRDANEGLILACIMVRWRVPAARRGSSCTPRPVRPRKQWPGKTVNWWRWGFVCTGPKGSKGESAAKKIEEKKNRWRNTTVIENNGWAVTEKKKGGRR